MTKKISTIKKWWIWFWYNDLTRFLFVMFPLYFIILIPLLIWAGVSEDLFRIILTMIYVSVWAWAIIDNDYSNLRKIGLDEYRKPLKNKLKEKE